MVIYKREINVKSIITLLKLNIPEDYKKKCIKELYRLGDSMDKTTNVKAIMTTYSIWQESKVFSKLLDNITRATTDTRDEDFVAKDSHLVLENAWGAIYQKGHYTKPHHHYPFSYLSFVYYLQTTPNTPLIFSNDRHEVNPQNDLLVIFPGYVTHEVPIHKDIKDRIVLAGNFTLSNLNK